MICPYIQNFEVAEQSNEIDEDGYVKKCTIKTLWSNMQCQKENCAVYNKRTKKCNYNK